ncbi:Cannabinoid receptor [Dirofilaria immitis]
MSWAVQQIALYTICIPIIFALCILAAFFNLLVLLARIKIKNRSGALELTFSLAVSDIWTSIVVVASLFRNSYMPVVLGINYTSICFSLTLETFAKSTTTIRKHRIVVASGLIFGTFVIGWLPASLLYIFTAQDMPLYRIESIWLNIFALTTLILIMIKSITNPIIYATRIPEIRHLIDDWRNNIGISGNKNKNDRRNCQEQETSFCKIEKNNRSEMTN